MSGPDNTYEKLNQAFEQLTEIGPRGGHDPEEVLGLLGIDLNDAARLVKESVGTQTDVINVMLGISLGAYYTLLQRGEDPLAGLEKS